jgi:hypothetical protein
MAPFQAGRNNFGSSFLQVILLYPFGIAFRFDRNPRDRNLSLDFSVPYDFEIKLHP